MIDIKVETMRGTLLDGVLFDAYNSDTCLIAITGIHGNFYSNPFYYNIGKRLNQEGIDFIYAQTNDALGYIKTFNTKTNEEEVIGSWNEDFNDTIEDVKAYIDYAYERDYEHIILAGHSLGANKIIYYLSRYYDHRVEYFIMISPADVSYLVEFVTDKQKDIILSYMNNAKENEIIPFMLFGWIECTARTAYNWVFNNILNNVHMDYDGDFSQIESIKHEGAFIIGGFDTFTKGNPEAFINNINNHMLKKDKNKIIVIEETGHTYQQKEDDLADEIAKLIKQ